MANALKKINARVKVLQKKHPKSKRSTLQKQAGQEWKAGKLKGAVGAVRKTRKKTAKKKTTRRKRPVKVITRTVVKYRNKPKAQRKYKPKKVRVKAYKAKRYRRVSGVGKVSPVIVGVGLAAAALIGWQLLKPKTIPINGSSVPLTQRSPAATSNAQTIIAIASSIGIVGAALSKLIETINNSSDDQLATAAASGSSGVFQLSGD